MTAEAAAWPWRVALETRGHDAAAAPPHTLAKLIEGEKLPWGVARVEKALRREDDAADAVFVLGDDSGATMVAQFSTRAAAQAGGEVRAGSVVAVRRPATLRGAGDATASQQRTNARAPPTPAPRAVRRQAVQQGQHGRVRHRDRRRRCGRHLLRRVLPEPVSYTHLTLPTIYSV